MERWKQRGQTPTPSWRRSSLTILTTVGQKNPRKCRHNYRPIVLRIYALVFSLFLTLALIGVLEYANRNLPDGSGPRYHAPSFSGFFHLMARAFNITLNGTNPTAGPSGGHPSSSPVVLPISATPVGGIALHSSAPPTTRGVIVFGGRPVSRSSSNTLPVPATVFAGGLEDSCDNEGGMTAQCRQYCADLEMGLNQTACANACGVIGIPAYIVCSSSSSEPVSVEATPTSTPESTPTPTRRVYRNCEGEGDLTSECQDYCYLASLTKRAEVDQACLDLCNRAGIVALIVCPATTSASQGKSFLVLAGQVC